MEWLRRRGILISFSLMTIGFFWFSITNSNFFCYKDLYLSEKRAFDKRIWKTQSSKRLSMVDDLLEKHSPNNLTEMEIVKLLGSPNSYGNHTLSNEKILCYSLANGRSELSRSALEVTLFDGVAIDCSVNLNLADPNLPEHPLLK